MKQKVFIYFLCCFYFPAMNLAAQYYMPQSNQWAMGKFAGLDFSNGEPTVLVTQLGGFLNEGCASVCNRQGELLFYSNGETVWDASGIVMPHGVLNPALFGLSSGTNQGSLIVPDPGNTSRFYLFSLTYTPVAKLYCNVVDMTLNNGLGDIDTSFYLYETPIKDSLTEQMTAIKGCNNSIWVLVHAADTTRFFAYNISASGINLTPVESVTGILSFSTVANNNFILVGAIKAAPNGSRILTCELGNAKGAEVHDFDNTTGIVSNSVLLDSTFGYYNGDFSPSGNRVYAQTPDTALQGQGASAGIFQFTLNSEFPPSQTKYFAGPSYYVSDLKLAPDQKIYFCAYTYGQGEGYYAGRINSPDASEAACNFQDSVIALHFTAPGSYLGRGLPNTLIVPGDHTSRIALDTLICNFPDTAMLLSTVSGFSNYIWNDNVAGSSRTITQQGIYWVTYSTSTCTDQTDTFIIRGADLPPLLITFNQDTLSTTDSFSAYQWYKNDTLIPGATGDQYAVDGNGWYTVVVNNSGCTDSAGYEVTTYTGIDPTGLESKIFIYPNPTNGVVYISSPIAVNCTVLNLEGKILVRSENKKSMDLGFLDNGIYFLKMEHKRLNLHKVEKIVIKN